ncbi:hypothetical protein VOLCADRAFT_98275 [Volvox carteri f. nagariensis]|uniref:Uncharacterized protein n=1 Tax=Volvox carteri f. nagariensis TaxID=3068 RepID=D8UF15_VOLCA|nr:uncharacterized protein VOLCADRAFT_98275 [Volvox carteri f. nagariensis]EFJ41692.1 hypothetical protein VOLCADRAFT_98275 [Volvox carteri f. nagariensis]|eukprot:XP_002957194.1 hypothetical protein VOLCADRAFT_98275 [Volvox carteri f. nagariensis]
MKGPPQQRRCVSFRLRDSPALHNAQLSSPSMNASGGALRSGSCSELALPAGLDDGRVESPTLPRAASIPNSAYATRTQSTTRVVHDGSPFRTSQRVSFDSAQLNFASAALVPTSLAVGYKRRSYSTNGTEAMERAAAAAIGDTTAATKAGAVRTLSSRRMEVYRRSSGNGVGCDSRGGGALPYLLSDCGKTAAAPATSPSLELPSLQFDQGGRFSVGHEHAPPLSAASSRNLLSTVKDGLQPPPIPKLRCLQPPRLSEPLEESCCCGSGDTGDSSTGGINCDCEPTEDEEEEDEEEEGDLEADFAATAISLSPRASQPRVIVGQMRPTWQRQLQQEQCVLPGSVESSSSPRSNCEAAVALGALRAMSNSLTYMRPQLDEHSPPSPLLPQQEEQQQQQPIDDVRRPHAAGCFSGPPGHVRAKSLSVLRLKGIPEEDGPAGLPAPRWSTGQCLELGGGLQRLPSLNSPNGPGGSGPGGNASGGSGSSRFSGRVAQELSNNVVQVQRACGRVDR